MSKKIDISVIILTYNVKYFLENTLHSVFNSKTDYSYEVIVVDNNSSDGSPEYIQNLFPDVNYIFNSWNAGFAKGNNLGLKIAKGDYILVLNPDTHLHEQSLQLMTNYLKEDTSCDMCSCKLITPDGVIDENCHRGFPTAWNSFSHISGLAKLFPNSKFFSSYLLTYLSEDLIADVDAISGSFMFFRREIIDQGIFFPEYYFMYGEDLDFCYQIRKKGFTIKYVPITSVIHYKGQSSKKDRIKIRRHFFEAMSIFVEKNYSRKYSGFFRLLIRFAVFIAYLSSVFSIMAKKLFTPIMDTLSFLSALFISLFFYKPTLNIISPHYAEKLTDLSIQDYFIPTFVYLLLLYIIFFKFEIYHKHKRNYTKFLHAVFTYGASAVTLTYFFKFFAYSRLVLLFLLSIHSGIMFIWRIILQPKLKIYKDNALIVGIDEISMKLLDHKKELNRSGYEVKGYLDLDKTYLGKNIQGMPVFGNISNINDIVKQELIDTVIFSIKSTGLKETNANIEKLTEDGISYKFLPDFLEIKNKKIKFVEFSET